MQRIECGRACTLIKKRSRPFEPDYPCTGGGVTHATYLRVDTGELGPQESHSSNFYRVPHDCPVDFRNFVAKAEELLYEETSFEWEDRFQLMNRCNEAVGGNELFLAQILSMFPNQAELFIETQEYAFQKWGDRAVRYYVHHAKGGPGFGGLKKYSDGQVEYLDESGFSGYYLSNLIYLLFQDESNKCLDEEANIASSSLGAEISDRPDLAVCLEQTSDEIYTMVLMFLRHKRK